MIDNGESGQEPVFLPMYVRPDLRPVAVIGWICALIAAITVYTWVVIQINDTYYEGVSNSRCHTVYEKVKNVHSLGGYDWIEKSRHIEVLTDERDNVHNWRQVEGDCRD